MGEKIQLLECTIRDGGLGLEDAWLNKIAMMDIQEDDRKKIIRTMAETRAEIIEIGSIEISEQSKRRFGIYQSIEEASEEIPHKCTPDQMFVAMFRGPDTSAQNIPVRKESFLDGVRVIIRYSELQKSLDFCAMLSEKGYKVFIQPMVTMRYTDSEIDLMIEAANRMHAYALYFVDSYGYMSSDDIQRFYRLYNSNLDRDIRIGFHAHNNMNLAFANVLTLLKEMADREIIIDATATGMGQGAGNLQTEIIANYLNSQYAKKYNYSKVLELCELVEKYNIDGLWGYSVMRLLSANHQVAYKYAVSFRKIYHLTYTEIDHLLTLLKKMPLDMQHRYTQENAIKLLQEN